MVFEVVKRDGRQSKFDKEKIIWAVQGAFEDIDGDAGPYAKKKANEIGNYIANMDKAKLTVEEIQDIVEKKQMESQRKDVARQFIIYRNDRNRIRQQKSELMKAVGEKLAASNIENQNANVDEMSFGGRMGEAKNVVTKQYALDNCMSKKSRDNHLNNRIYIHDLDSYASGMHNCQSVPFDDQLANGFYVRQTDVRPAQSINTAMQQVAVIFQVQSLQQFGGVSATHLDWTMVPYVRKSFYKHYADGCKYIGNLDDDNIHKVVEYAEANDLGIEDEYFKQDEDIYRYAKDMTVKETYQAVEGLQHNLNTLQSRSGNQLPFTSINYGTCTEPEGRQVTKALLDTSLKGNGRLHRTPIFPCGIFQCMKGVNRQPGDPNYDQFQLALKSTATRQYPNYANVDWSGNAGYDRNDPRTFFSTMGCRTANGWDVNGLGQLKDGRGNICPVTIIMPTQAMEAKETFFDTNKETVVDVFMRIQDDAIHDAKDMLQERFDYICSQPPEAAEFMYANGTMAGYVPEEGIRSALKHGTIVIGQLGQAETLQILIGCDHTEERGMEQAKKIEQLFKDRCAEFKQEYKQNFGVYFTPSENQCYTAMKKFKERYGTIKNVSDRQFFTNSMHVPVWKKVSPFEKIDIESQLTGYSSAGCITYVELDGGVKHNTKALETIVNYAMDHDIPYFAINVPNDMCMDCGYTDEINETCPMCGSDRIQRLRRVTGYQTGDYKSAFNKGKQQETEMRVKHR